LTGAEDRLGTRPTLFLADDDFIRWELSGARVTPAYFSGVQEISLRPQKAFVYGQPLDFDSVSSTDLNRFDWVITTRDAAGSEAPVGMRLVRVTPNYELWRRTATIASRETLSEGPLAAALLDCTTVTGRTLAGKRGIARVRAPSREVPVPPLPAGASVTVGLHLPAGAWDLETPYYSPLPVRVTAPGLRVTLPANLERPGPRWPIGRIVLSQPASVSVSFRVLRPWLAPESDAATPASLIATLEVPAQTVPLRSACGRLVDWYQLARVGERPAAH
jgi:hypothetical protein